MAENIPAYGAPDEPIEPQAVFLRRVSLDELAHWQRRCEALERALAYKAQHEAPAPVLVTGDTAALARRVDALTKALRKYADRANWTESAEASNAENLWVGETSSGHEVAERALECEPGGGAQAGAEADIMAQKKDLDADRIAKKKSNAERNMLVMALRQIKAGPFGASAEDALRLARDVAHKVLVAVGACTP